MHDSARRTSPRVATRGTVVGVALFWVGTLGAGALAPGYSARADFVSSLAGWGSSVAVLGVGALTALALAHLAAAAAVRGWAATPLGLAGMWGLVVAWFRTACPLGAAGCGSGANETPGDVADLLHGWGVVGYEVSLLVAMAVLACRLARVGRPLAAVLTVAAGVLSVVLALRIGGPDLGAWQRAWLVVNTGWLVVVVTRLAPPR